MSGVLDLSYKITHQPTAAEPYVETNDSKAAYQWCAAEDSRTEVVDDGVIGDYYEDSYYDEETGWNGQWWGDDGADYLYVYLEEGQTVTIVPSAYCEELGIWSYNYYDYYDYDECNAGEEFKYTAEAADWYGVYAYTDYADETTLRAYVDEETYTAIEGETSAELKNPEIGKKYACEVTFVDDTTETSDAFEYKYAITHQPTEAEPYVELNDDTDASYQWYTVEVGGAEITDENASGDWQSLGAPFDNTVYEDGKWIADDSVDEQYYFMIELEAGDTVNLEFASEVEFIVFAINGDISDYIEVGGTECSVTVEESGTYWLVLGTSVDYVRATIGDVKYTPIDGQTSAILTPTALGKYACEVTFADGTTEMSDIFEVTKLHDCDFSGEWKYDADKHWKECECGLTSEEGTHTGGTATCTELAKCEHCGASYGEVDWTNHEGEYVTVWYNDYQHVSEYECCHIGSSVVYEDHKYENYTVITPADCVNNAWEMGKCICGGIHTREIEGTALSHSFTKYEVTEEAECGVAGKEVAYCDHGCQTTDERETPALDHIFLDYVSNGDATCTADGTKTAFCIHGCGATDTVADEGTKLNHIDEDGDKICDDCGSEVEERCDICGGKAHGDNKLQLLFCLITTIIRFVISICKTIN